MRNDGFRGPRRQQGFIFDIGSAVLSGVGKLFDRGKRRKASKKLQEHLMQFADERLELSRHLAGWLEREYETNWEALRPQREMGEKAIAALDANMAMGRYNAQAPAPPQGGQPALPVWGTAPGQSGVRPPTYAPPGVTGAAPWPSEVDVTRGAPLPKPPPVG